MVSLFIGVPYSLIKGNCVLMLFQMPFLRGFLQSHFIKHKACSELLQGAFVIGTRTRSPLESFPTKWNLKYIKRITTYNITQTTRMLSFVFLGYIFPYCSSRMFFHSSPTPQMRKTAYATYTHCVWFQKTRYRFCT